MGCPLFGLFPSISHYKSFQSLNSWSWRLLDLVVRWTRYYISLTDVEILSFNGKYSTLHDLWNAIPQTVRAAVLWRRKVLIFFPQDPSKPLKTFLESIPEQYEVRIEKLLGKGCAAKVKLQPPVKNLK